MILMFREQDDEIITMSQVLMTEANVSRERVVQDAKFHCKELGESLVAVLEWPDMARPRFLYAPVDAETREECEWMAVNYLTKARRSQQGEGIALR